jgi:hypothetical protein
MIAGLVKLYFREMPEPLIPFELYDAILAAAGTLLPPSLDGKIGSPAASRVGIMKNIIDLLEPDSKLVLKVLCWHLFRVHHLLPLTSPKQVAQHSEHNKMTLDNLSIVFAPNLVRPRQETIATMLGLFQLNYVDFYR